MNWTLTLANGPAESCVLIVISKSPEAKKLATEDAASGKTKFESTSSIRPLLTFNGHVQSIPKTANSGSQSFLL